MPPLDRRHRRLLAGALLVVLVVGCTTGPAPSVQSATPAPSGHGPTAVPTDPGATPAGTAPSQTDTAWGRIWDGLPEAFPRFPGASPSETGEGPASAILDVGDAPPAQVASYYQGNLELAGFVTVGVDGPREDGSWEISSKGTTGCQIRTTMTPLGGITIVTILYGADCPFD